MDNSSIKIESKQYNNQIQNLSDYAKSLKGVNHDEVISMVLKDGWDVTARSLGFKIEHYDNLKLAGWMVLYAVQDKTPSSIEEYANRLKSRFTPEVYNYLIENKVILQELVQSRKDVIFNCDWFSANSFLSYLAKPKDGENIVENVQFMWLRISIAHHIGDFQMIKSMFNNLCDQYYITASPTIYNAGFVNGQMASCFLIPIGDNLESILYTGVGDSGLLSKYNGGLGIDMSRLRHSKIGAFGKSNGLIPWIYLYNAVVRAVNQGGRRKGACTLYCRPHHVDIYEFCEAGLKTGDHYQRAHDVNFAVWFPWIFWERVKNDENWSLFCPAETNRLNDLWGFEFEAEYIKCENDPKINRKTVKARDFYKHIVECQRKCSMPYIMHGDTCNMKSNHKNLGYIRCSNLCLEIVEFSSTDEIAVCNLASISLKAFVKTSSNKEILDSTGLSDSKILEYIQNNYDFDKLGSITRECVINLNKVIDCNFYPLEKARKSNMKNRPIGLGIQGLAEALHAMDFTFHDIVDPKVASQKTKIFNKMISACIYWNALAQSIDLAIKDGAYQNFEGSPFSEGKLQFDLWQEEFKMLKSKGRIDFKVRKEEDDDQLDPWTWCQKSYKLSNGDEIQPSWISIKRCLKLYGIRNSLLTTKMPTASSSQPLRNCESDEAHQTNLYTRKVLQGNYPVINRYLLFDLENLGLWNKYTFDLLQADQGSIKYLADFIRSNKSYYPCFDFNNKDSWNRLLYVQEKYKTMWELSMKVFLELSADRGRYIDQSQSTNIYISDPTDAQLMALHMLTASLGLKTGMYYLRQAPAMQVICFTVDPHIANFVKDKRDNKNDVIESLLDENDKKRDTDVSNLKSSLTLKKSQKIRFCDEKEMCISCQ
jgi:ribonucleoside-diphosphate reductase alpha subunit